MHEKEGNKADLKKNEAQTQIYIYLIIKVIKNFFFTQCTISFLIGSSLYSKVQKIIRFQ